VDLLKEILEAILLSQILVLPLLHTVVVVAQALHLVYPVVRVVVLLLRQAYPQGQEHRGKASPAV
jgi:hypothetical protein